MQNERTRHGGLASRLVEPPCAIYFFPQPARPLPNTPLHFVTLTGELDA